jgi:Tfp pilus assembly protein PilF
MPPLILRTLGTVSLSGARGDIPLEEPRLVALLVLLAVAGDVGMSEGDLLLRIAPDSKAEIGRLELARLVAVANLSLGSKAAIVRTPNGYALAPGFIALDVRVSPEPLPESASSERSECAEFLAGFKLPGSPEFRDWIVATRRRVEPRGDAEATGPSKWLARPRLALVGLVAIIGIAASLAAPHRTKGFATGDPLLLSDIKNETGDTVFDVGLMSATSIALQQSGRLRLYSRSRLPEVYRLMRITNRDTALTFELAKEVAQRDGVRFVLALQIDRMGDGYRVTGRLVDVSTPEQVTAISAMARSRNEVLAALDEVLLAMRARLGETRRDIDERRVPLPFVTTASLEALRSYGDGAVAWSRGDYQLAKELWLSAVDIDTGFAMAYGALGMASYFTHNRDDGERYYAEAFRRTNRLSEHERLRLMESRLGYRGYSDSAIVYSALLAQRYPSVTTWYNYGTSLMSAERDSEASIALHTALSYDPRHVSSYINLATLKNGMRQFDSALAYYVRADRIDSTALYRNNINHEYGNTLVRLGRYAEAESAFSRMSKDTRLDSRALGFRSLGYLALWRGRTDDAIEYYRRATAVSVQIKSSPLGEARNRMLLSTAYRTAGRDRESNDEITATMAMIRLPSLEPQVLAMLATNAIKLGRVADVQSILKVLRAKMKADSRVDVAAEAYVAGLLALSAHHADSALQYARAATALPTTIQRLTLEAEAWRALGRADSARAVVQRIVAYDGFGFEGQDDLLHAPLVLGDLMLAQHDTSGAMKEYQRLLDQWRAAPPSQADVAAARSRLASLRAATPDRPRE